MFNRRHYEFVATIIRDTRIEIKNIPSLGATRGIGGLDTVEKAASATLDSLVWRFADAFAKDNPLFNADRFFNATVDGVIKRPRTA